MRRLSLLSRLLALLSILSGPFLHAATTINFTLTDGYTTSAGVFKPDGTLVRTLWGKVAYPAGSQSYVWDDKDDAGLTVPAGTYQFKVVYHNIDYTWEGTIGNTSSTFNGYTRRAFIMVTDLATDGTDLYSAMGYNENQPGVQRSRITDPQTASYSVPKCITTTYYHITTDGTWYYMASTGQGVDFGRNYTFVHARKVSDNTFATFANGTSLCLQSHPSGGCYVEHTFPSAIDVESGNAHPATGIAVQKTGSILAVAHGNLNEVRLIDKTTGFDIADIVITNPKKIAFAPNGDLWVISGTTVQRFDGATLGTTNTPVTTISGFSSPQSVSVHPSDNDVVLVADAGTSQQVKAYTRTGASLWTYGTLGGGYATDAAVTTTKLSFASGRTFVTAMADGSFWVSDTGNDRILHISSSRTYIEQVQYIPAAYVATSDPKFPSRVLGHSWLEFQVDYSKPLLPGDPFAAGGNNSWKLIKNWSGAVPADYRGAVLYEGITCVVTLSNGRTYGLLRNFTTSKRAVVELPATGTLRFTGIEVSLATNLYENGDLRTWSSASSVQTITNQALTGFDGSGNPTWAAPTTLTVGTGSAARFNGSFSGPGGARFPITSSNLMVSFSSDVTTTGMHLGAIPVGGTVWKWLASPSVATAAYETPAGQNGTFSKGNGVNYAGNQVHAIDRNIIYGYHGEGYNGGQANQFMHFRDDGLFIGQFGTVNSPSILDARPGLSGNAFSLSMVKVNTETYLWVNDESNHGGIHRWRLTNANNIGELSASGAAGTTIALGSSTTAAPAQIKDNADGSGIVQTGAWTASTNAGFYSTNFWHDGNTGKGTKSVRFTPTIPVAGNYQVYGWWVASSSRATNTPIDIIHADGTSTFTADQRYYGSKWTLLGTYRFTAGTSGSILVRNDGTNGFVVADAFRLVYAPSQISDNADTTGITVTGAWTASTFGAGLRFGSDYLQDDNTGKGTKSVRFTPTLDQAGSYEVFAWWNANTNRATNTPIDVIHAGGTTTVTVNQQANGAQWNSLGVYTFPAGTSGSVLVRTTGTNGYVIADAVRFVKQP